MWATVNVFNFLQLFRHGEARGAEVERAGGEGMTEVLGAGGDGCYARNLCNSLKQFSHATTDVAARSFA